MAGCGAPPSRSKLRRHTPKLDILLAHLTAPPRATVRHDLYDTAQHKTNDTKRDDGADANADASSKGTRCGLPQRNMGKGCLGASVLPCLYRQTHRSQLRVSSRHRLLNEHHKVGTPQRASPRAVGTLQARWSSRLWIAKTPHW